MKNLPAEVSDEDVEEMWNYADKNGDGRLSYKEFKVKYFYIYLIFNLNVDVFWRQVMINPPLPPSIPKPHITDIGMQPQMFSPPATKETPTNMASPLLPSKVLNIAFNL